MIESTSASQNLIGYLSFDTSAHHATLVVCSRRGRPLREVRLAPIGALGRFVVRLGIRLGRFGRSCRAIAVDECDLRTFAVWIAAGRTFVVCDESGERWLKSVAGNPAMERGARVTTPEIVALVRTFGFGDTSRN